MQEGDFNILKLIISLKNLFRFSPDGSPGWRKESSRNWKNNRQRTEKLQIFNVLKA